MFRLLHFLLIRNRYLNIIENNIKVIIIKCERKKKGQTDVENSVSLYCNG